MEPEIFFDFMDVILMVVVMLLQRPVELYQQLSTIS